MSLTVNGVAIPTNVANALKFNGTNISQVFHNGVSIWKQALFSAIWSGTSTTGYPSDLKLETSGVNFRYNGKNSSGVYNNGAWLVTNSSGLPTGSVSGNFGYFVLTLTSTAPSTLRFDGGTQAYGNITFTMGVGFSGTSGTLIFGDPTLLETSGGLIRIRQSNYAGAWISLT